MVGLRVTWQQWMRRGGLTLAAVAGGLTLLTGCAVGPDYVRPTVITPAAYKAVDGWKVAQPQDEVLRGAWVDSPPDHHAHPCGETARRRGVEPLTYGFVVQGVIHPSIGARGRETEVQAWGTSP